VAAMMRRDSGPAGVLQQQELIGGLVRKEDAAFRQAIKQYQSSMLYLAHSFVGNKIADEVAQEAWFSAIRALPKFESRRSLKTWLHIH